jgi:hypothetical protein
MGPHTLIQCAYIPYESILKEQGSNDPRRSRCGAARLLGFGEQPARAQRPTPIGQGSLAPPPSRLLRCGWDYLYKFKSLGPEIAVSRVTVNSSLPRHPGSDSAREAPPGRQDNVHGRPWQR